MPHKETRFLLSMLCVSKCLCDLRYAGHPDTSHCMQCPAGGILESVSETVIALEVKEGAHHLDLMWAEDEDPRSVRDVRDRERACMKSWIGQYSSTQAGAKNNDSSTAAA